MYSVLIFFSLFISLDFGAAEKKKHGTDFCFVMIGRVLLALVVHMLKKRCTNSCSCSCVDIHNNNNKGAFPLIIPLAWNFPSYSTDIDRGRMGGWMDGQY